MVHLIVLALVCLTVLSVEASVSYDGYKVYEITLQKESQAKFLLKYDDKPGFDFWVHSRLLNMSSTVMVSPQEQKSFENDLIANGLGFKVTINNVQHTILAEDIRQKSFSPRSLGGVTFSHYMSYHEITSYMRSLAANHPDIVTLVDIGKTYEGRDMLLLEISTDRSANKPVIFVDAGIHAREWIAPPVALYIINQLVENPENRHMLDKIDWAISPCINPDGYDFTQTGNRMWRKTRSPGRTTTCYGADPNRNWGYYWMEAGASANECSETYAGPEAFSEIETANVRDYLLAHSNNIKLYLTFHSYGSMILYPWGYTSALPDDELELRAVAQRAANAIAEVSDERYVYGTSTNVLYVAAGGSDDYAKGVVGIELSYCIELPTGGQVGFNPPANRILPIVQETFAGIRAYHGYIEEKFASDS